MCIGKDLVRNLERHIELHIACDIVKDNGGRLDFLQFSQDLGSAVRRTVWGVILVPTSVMPLGSLPERSALIGNRWSLADARW